MWKITNTSSPAQNIKVAVAKNNTTTIGVILKPGQFCITDDRLTSSLDAQCKKNFLTVDQNFENNLNLRLCEAYDQSDIDKATKEAVDYKTN